MSPFGSDAQNRGKPGGRRTFLRTYELVFIVQPALDEEGLNALVEQVQQVITENEGEIVKVEQMGKRRLAYPIRHLRDGYYVLMHAKLERLAMAELERMLKLSEDVLRHLLVRLDEAEEDENAHLLVQGR